MQIGPFTLSSDVIAAPMAGVTDKPYRQICRRYGAGLAVTEMVTSQVELRSSRKTAFRSDLDGEVEPIAVQIVGAEPDLIAEAAQYNVENGAQIIDINMGCPAKKVCKKAAGSALLAQPELVEKILRTAVAAVDAPVTVKIRIGTDRQHINASEIARIAEQAGVQAITVHGRTRACKFVGPIDYHSIAQVKQAVSIPVIANGDINSAQQAQAVLEQTNADAVMVGRAALGRPWLFNEIAHYLTSGTILEQPNLAERIDCIIRHIKQIHSFYDAHLGVRLARKHIKWYLQYWPQQIAPELSVRITKTESLEEQLELTQHYLNSSSLSLAA